MANNTEWSHSYSWGGSSSGWIDVENIAVDSDSVYTYQTVYGATGDLTGTDFDFSTIPTTATIIGIEVEVRLDTDFNTFVETQIQLVKDGSLKGNNKSTSTAISTSWATMTYGGSDDLWGWTTVTVADIQDSGFGLVGEWTSGASKTIYVNTFRIKIYYDENDTSMFLMLGAF